MKEYPLFLAGQWIQSNQTLSVNAPWDGTELARVHLADESLIEQAIQKGLEAQKSLLHWPAYKRADFLREVALKLKNQAERFALSLAREAAKPYQDALGEVLRASETFLIASEEARRFSGEYMRLDWTAAGEGLSGRTRWVPSGLVAGISPFNFPLNLAVHKLAPAIACGAPIVLKPASSTPLATLMLAELFQEVGGLPQGAVSILPASREAGNLLVTHPQIATLSFTGSDKVGWKLKQAAGKKKSIMELGGNAALIISEHAPPIHDFIGQLTKGCFAYAGQICIHTQRIFVHHSRFDETAEALVREAKNLNVGPPESPNTNFSCMIDASNAKRVSDWIQEAINQGAKALLHGKQKGTLHEPTILTQTKAQMSVRSEELFGPAVCIEPYHDFQEALQLVNEGRYGLQAGLFTSRDSEIQEAFQNLDVGGLLINRTPTLRLDHMPYGGVKDSGLGREGVRYAMKDYCEPRLLVHPGW